MGGPEAELRSTVRVVPAARPRKLAKVPFVELADGRLQGVVSSGSDIERVYVSSVTAGTQAVSCSTNNNRPCGGLYGASCKHVRLLVTEAEVQYGTERVARYLQLDAAEDLVTQLRGPVEQVQASVVFARFLRHLSYLELPATTEPVPELHWFPAAAAH